MKNDLVEILLGLAVEMNRHATRQNSKDDTGLNMCYL